MFETSLAEQHRTKADSDGTLSRGLLYNPSSPSSCQLLHPSNSEERRAVTHLRYGGEVMMKELLLPLPHPCT